MNPTQLICDIGELNHLFKNSISIEHFLEQTVQMVAKHLKTNVCSIYIYDEDERKLILKASEGLNTEQGLGISLSLGEGLVGLALKELRLLNVENASRHPNYKSFKGIGEEKFDNFLSIPIARGVNRVGVLSLQRDTRHKFSRQDEVACIAVASQLANIIENAKFLISLHSGTEQKPAFEDEQVKSQTIRANVASKGIAHCKSIIIDKDRTFRSLLRTDFTTRYGLDDFHKAVKLTEQQLENLQKQVEEKLSDAASLIFASHLLILKDKEFIGTMAELISKDFNPPQAILKVAKEYIDIFTESQNIYVREKIQDIEDLVVRLIGNIESDIEKFAEIADRIVIAREVFPSDLLKYSGENIGGIILASGGVTSHISILARSLRIPMVIANDASLLTLPNGTDIVLDAQEGVIYINPNTDAIEKFKHYQTTKDLLKQQQSQIKDITLTKDNVQIALYANVNLFSDAQLAVDMHCEGVGLYRTEFPFIIRNNFPSEQEQFVTYRRLTELMENRPVIFRTLDIGGDKVLSYYHNAREQNPFLGMRSIRFCLENKDVFAQQIKAILRAGADIDLKIMFPMISSLDEFIQSKDFVYECMSDLKIQGQSFNQKPQIGMMIELPCVVEFIEDFAKVSDFFSIGTNDFVQFMLGVDRTNENVAKFYLPHHPAVLRAIYKTAQAALKYNKDISVCGDMANNEKYIKFLIGAGIKTISVDPAYMPSIQKIVEQINYADAKLMIEKVVNASTISRIEQLMGINTKVS